MKVLVTGVAGFLGSHLAEALLNEGHEVIGIDNLVGGYLDNVPRGTVFHQMDCEELPNAPHVIAGVELVYHCAALAYEGLSVFSPSIVVNSIVGASTAVFSAAINARVRRIIHCSSMARYGSVPTPYDEEMVCQPQDPYGIAKLAAEQILVNLCGVHNTEYVIAVPHNIIGPRQKYDDPYRNVASIMMNRMLQGKQPIIYGTGEQKRCFSFIDDCLLCLLNLRDAPAGQVYNIGPDEESVTINQLAHAVSDVTAFGQPLEPIYMPGRPQEVQIALCSSAKARRLLGYHNQTSLWTGLARMCFAMVTRGPRPFDYHLPIEIQGRHYCPKTWTDRIF